MNWIKYLLEANLYLALFYAAYYLLLRRETYYQLNRAYLLGSSLLAFIIPLLQLGFLKPAAVQASITQTANDVIVTPFAAHPMEKAAPALAALPVVNYYVLIYIIVAVILTAGFTIRIIQLIRLSKKGKHTQVTNFKIIEIDEDDQAFSFFNYLFIGKKLTNSDTVIRHEIVHIEQRHSLDIIYLELLKIICWFNPFIYLLKYSIKEIHEFIADSRVSATGEDVDAYTDFLISNAYGLTEVSLANNFFNKNLLKTRIIMLHQKRSGNLARFKYLVALPLLAGMLCISTLGFTKNYKMIDLVPGDHAVNKPLKPQHKLPPAPAVTDTNKIKKPAPPKPKVDQVVMPPKPHVDQRLAPPRPKVQPFTTPPKPKVDKLPMPPKPKVDKVRFPIPLTSDAKAAFEDFYKYLARNTRYPRLAHDQSIAGNVYAYFQVGSNHQVQQLQVTSSSDSSFTKEVTRVLANSPLPDAAKIGAYYLVTFSFDLVNYQTDKTIPKRKMSYIKADVVPDNKSFFMLGKVSIQAGA